MQKLISILYLILISVTAEAQFAPPAGQTGTTAMHADSSTFIAWASSCTIIRGKQDISSDTSGYATVGDSSSAIGQAGTNGIVSLGDGGTATLSFTVPIADGPGPDFAVFENSFSDDYLEFGIVEVSSDGVNFFRFPAVCNIQDTVQTGPFDLSDATKVHNLAGKYRANYGTPFDLAEIPDNAMLNKQNILFVRIIDVIGSIDPAYASYDMNGNKINDPFPTPYPSSGFDLDAVGVINTAATGMKKQSSGFSFTVFPNPASDKLFIRSNSIIEKVKIYNTNGEIVAETTGNSIDVSKLPEGLYFIEVLANHKSEIKKLIIQR